MLFKLLILLEQKKHHHQLANQSNKTENTTKISSIKQKKKGNNTFNKINLWNIKLVKVTVNFILKHAETVFGYPFALTTRDSVVVSVEKTIWSKQSFNRFADSNHLHQHLPVVYCWWWSVKGKYLTPAPSPPPHR